MAIRGRVLDLFHPAVAAWFRDSFEAPTPPQTKGWPSIARGESTLILAPTGSGKTLSAFLWCINRVMFDPAPDPKHRCRVMYISPLKALAVDIERNLRAPLAGIAHRAAERGDAFHAPRILIRTGDTPAAERARFMREPADILITTPESLYLLLTSNARDALRSVDTVIVDEIHALLPTKRGAHLALSLERLERLVETRADGRAIQRIGLSATQRPLDEVARFLGGTSAAEAAVAAGRGAKSARRAPAARRARDARGARSTEGAAHAIHDEFGTESHAAAAYRPVTIVDTSEKKKLELRIEVPVEDMAKLGQPEEITSGPASQSPARQSIWTAIHPRLLELILAHRSTLIFVNSRRIAERLASALNELAGEVLVRSHHGSLARPQRVDVEDRLKAGQLRGLVATSSLELGIDMGAIDLVIQIEAPPSVASGMQRIGRAGHTIGAASRGVIVPKYRGDLVACAAVTRAMHDGRIESSRYPRNPLDVVAQQMVAMVAMEPWDVDDLYATLRGAAPCADLSRSVYEGVLDMLSGRYPSDDFADLRPRITWDRLKGTLTARDGARRVAVINGGTIPDRGLYGVFLVGERGPGARVGELDEEMVFESRPGETFLLGASTWRIEEITHDRVIVSPAPGQPGKMPFWKADAAGRPLELGRQIGEMVRTLRALPPAAAVDRLISHHDLELQAAENLMRYLNDQASAAGAVPDDRTIVIERWRDELGDWRICVLTPFGGRIHAPWAMAVVERARATTGIDVEMMWADDGFVVRFPETEEPPDPALMLPSSDEVEALVVRQLGSTALFAAKFREAAARALLLPKRRPGGRSPLWLQRKRAADLLAVASRFGSFPMLLEAYRECLRDVFDIPALVDTLRRIEQRQVKTVTVDSTVPSPFASALLFAYVANYIYAGDAPLAERRAQALSIDQAQLRELLGDVELRELLDADSLAEIEAQVQQLDPGYHARSVDGVHDMLLRLGDLTLEEIAARTRIDAPAAVEELGRTRRIIVISIGGEQRLLPVEYAGRYRDALGVPLPAGLPESLLQPSSTAPTDVARRYARTHGPFTTDEFAGRYALGRSTAAALLKEVASSGTLMEGEFRPGGSGREWCDPDILQSIRRRSLARLRKQVEPVEAQVFVRLLTSWQGLIRKRPGLDALLDAIEHLQGAPLPATVFESEILGARVLDYNPADLDALCAAGEVVWCGVEPIGDRDGRLALYLTDHLPRLRPLPPATELSGRERPIVDHFEAGGASFFGALHDAAGGGFPGDTVEALWNLVWKGLITNDTFHALRAFTRPPERRGRKARPAGRSFRSRRVSPPSAEGRWSLIAERIGTPASPTEWSTAVAQQLLSRYGVLTREVAGAEGIFGGFSAVYDVLKAMEDAGRIRRGYFVAGVGATQFALPAALELMRTLRDMPEEPETVVLSVTDPANPFGTMMKWPVTPDGEPGGRGATRTVGAQVVIVNGTLAAYIPRGGRQILAYLPEHEPARSTIARPLAERLASMARGEDGRGGLLVADINGMPAAGHALAPYLIEAGLYPSAMGFMARRAIEPRTQGHKDPKTEGPVAPKPKAEADA
ncbi:MAG TPA: DEAD/DEAH box helicase [Vicinamibacterales bacterium]|nr:DEAD/DEAH box helicase [Vicinamibacterales bacterium]